MENLFDFYAMLCRIVKGWPVTLVGSQESSCKRLNTFAVLQDESQLNSQNLDKDERYLGKDFFFSRRWADRNFRASEMSFHYPGLFLFADDQDLKIEGSCFQNTASFRLFVLDKFPRKNAETPGADDACWSRTAEEVEADTAEITERLLSLFLETVKAEVRFSTGGVETIWAPLSAVQTQMDVGVLTGFDILDEFHLSLAIKDSTFPMVSIARPFGMDDVVGSFVSFQVRFQRSFTTLIDPFASMPTQRKG